MQAKKVILASLLAAGLSMAGIGGVMAVDASHSHGDHGAAELTLNHGQKWATDDPLRKGMGNMRAAMTGNLTAIHDNTLSAAGYDALAGKIETEMAYVVANCKLDPAADMQLHLVLAQLGEGVTKMRSADTPAHRQEGAAATVKALNAYGRHFDHPGWQPLTHR